MKNFRHNFYQIFLCLDQLILCIFCLILGDKGWADLTLSAQAQRWFDAGVRKWPKYLINLIFFWEPDHCNNSLMSEKERKHTPLDVREWR